MSYALYVCTELVESFLNALLSTIYLLNVVYLARSIGTKGCNEQSNACSNVGRYHAASAQLNFVVVADHHSTVGVA